MPFNTPQEAEDDGFVCVGIIRKKEQDRFAAELYVRGQIRFRLLNFDKDGKTVEPTEFGLWVEAKGLGRCNCHEKEVCTHDRVALSKLMAAISY